ncbi:glycine dehydrogenase subunit 2 [Anopheles sinensis]|uniref:Glycine dehydrogenase subunit 2 n=1 Tax=Anopheles sinensis TaxID=74873 RepID=A0A084W2T6_ANOSI|nr:glycine dehydrogenase subunit 2 [Anopheles sinensis]
MRIHVTLDRARRTYGIRTLNGSVVRLTERNETHSTQCSEALRGVKVRSVPSRSSFGLVSPWAPLWFRPIDVGDPIDWRLLMGNVFQPALRSRSVARSSARSKAPLTRCLPVPAVADGDNNHDDDDDASNVKFTRPDVCGPYRVVAGSFRVFLRLWWLWLGREGSNQERGRYRRDKKKGSGCFYRVRWWQLSRF